MERIASFCVDHNTLVPGMYLSRKDVEYLISVPMLNTVTRNTINWMTPGKTVLFKYTE